MSGSNKQKQERRHVVVVVLLVLTMLFAFGSPPPLAAAETQAQTEPMLSEELLQASGAEALVEQTNGAVQAVLEQYDIRAGNPDAVDALSFSTLLDGIWQTLTQQLTAPLRLLLTLTAIVLFTAMLQSVQTSLAGGTQRMGDLLVVLSAVTAAAPPVCSSFLQVRAVLDQCTDFMTAFTPVFAGILLSSGSAGAAIGYQSAVYAMVQLMLRVVDGALLPVLSMGLALTIADAANPGISLAGMVRMAKTGVIWTLGVLMTLFLGVLSIQGIVRGATDSFATKTVRYVVSNFVPIVGGAVSDAYGTVMGSLRILRSTTGVVGIAALCILFFPVFTELVLYRFAVMIGAALAEMFSATALTRLLRGMEQVMQMAIAVLTCFSILFVVAIALVLLLSNGNTGIG